MAPTATGPATTAASDGGANVSALPGSLEEATARYTNIKTALKAGLAQKRTIDRSLIDLESQIYLFEGSYLQSTASSGGNIVKGFDSYLKNSSSSSSVFASGGYGSGSSSKRAAAEAAILDIPLEDRIFSLSSATYARSLEAKANETTGALDDSVRADEEDERVSSGKKSKKEASTVYDGKPKKKKDYNGSKDATTPTGESSRKERERSLISGAEGSAISTPSKPSSFSLNDAKSGSAMSKLKRKNTDSGSTGGKASTKRKKDDD